ncbi:MAG: GrpB family protein [Candidatus Moraniibacteriota bacterium]|nr:MAG: GrpB family protein [Candidatus Moranbacteria bacterium]
MLKENSFSRKYQVVHSDPEWQKYFESEKRVLSGIFGKAALSLEHIGGTSVPGLSAKPIVDILVTLSSLDSLSEFRTLLSCSGYRSLGSYGMPESELFIRESDGLRKVNLHIFPDNHPHVREMILLRDFFRSHPQSAQEYSILKRTLAAKYPNDSSSYRREKDLWMRDFLETICKESRKE